MRCRLASCRLSTSMPRSDPKHAEPMSVAACRRLLGHVGEGVSDEELTRLRDQLYEIARSAVTVFEMSATDTSDVKALDCLPASVREDALERASIIEFDAHLPRGFATRAAVSAYVPGIKKGR